MTKQAAPASSPAEMAVQYQRIPLARIVVSDDRLRKTDPAKVDALAHAFSINGQSQPIRVASTADGDFLLDIGLHRLEAARKLGWSHIWAGVVSVIDATVHERRLQEIFENLIRAELTALDRAIALTELKAVHEALHPEAKRGGDRKSQAVKNKSKNQTTTLGFRSDVAEKTGLSETAIDRAVAIAKGLSSGIRGRLQGTWLADHQAGLQTLSQQPETIQRQVLDILFATPPGAGSVADALALAEGKRLPSAAERQFRSVGEGLARLKPALRRQLYAAHEAEILAWVDERRGLGGGR